MKLKRDINFNDLIQYGFVEDEVNCEHPEDHYYHLNNYYNQIHEKFRIVINVHSRNIEIFCLSDGLENTDNLNVLYRMIRDGIIEI